MTEAAPGVQPSRNKVAVTDAELPLRSTASIGTVPIQSWQTVGHGRVTPEDRARIAREVSQPGYEIIKGKGATNYAVGLTVA